MSHHPHQMTSGSSLLERGVGGGKLPDTAESWFLAAGWLIFFDLDSLPPTSWDAGYPGLSESTQRG